MSCTETQYLHVNRLLLVAIGLWPYQRTKLVQFQIALFLSILISFILFQLTIFMTAEFTPNLIIQISSAALFFIIFLIKYSSFYINTNNVRSLLEQLQQISNELKDKDEIAILEKYKYYAKRYTIRITFITMCSLLIIYIQPIWPDILGIFLFLNKSRTHQTMKIMTEYFVDQENYFYLILLHANAAMSIGAIALIATGTLLIVCLKYACGMFRITSYRIEQTINTLEDVSLTNKIMTCRNIACAVDIHRKAMKLCQYLISSFEIPFFLLIAFFVVCLSLHLFRIFQTMTDENDIEGLLFHSLCSFIIITYMFLANYAGQEITDHYNNVFLTAYSVRWYIAPLQIQKLILFLLQRGNKTFNLTLGGLFITSSESFAKLVSASVSYFTVIYSMQE